MLLLNVVSCWKITFVMCFILCNFFMSMIIRCCLILCYLFLFVIVKVMGDVYYKLFHFFSFLFPNMYVSCITCLYVYKLENKVRFDLI